jgi:hypothetical protein
MGCLSSYKDKIKYYLSEIKELIDNDCYSIEINASREENLEFLQDYNINTKKEKEILMSLEYTDFCYAVKNKTNNPKYANEILYIFNKNYPLFKIGEDCSENIDIYIKTNKIDTRSGKRVIVISFHKRNKNIEYLFKQ